MPINCRKTTINLSGAIGLGLVRGYCRFTSWKLPTAFCYLTLFLLFADAEIKRHE